MIADHKQHAKIHRAIGKLIEVEQELEGISRDHELKAAGLRHSLYSLLGFAGRDAGNPTWGNRVDLDPDAVGEILRGFGDGTAGDVFEPLIGDGAIDPLDFGDNLDSDGTLPGVF